MPRRRDKHVPDSVAGAGPGPAGVQADGQDRLGGRGVIGGQDAHSGRGGGPDALGGRGWDALAAIVNDPQSPAAARASAARSMAEIEGRLGRHAPPPPRATITTDQLTRAELVAELVRLRALVPLPSG